MKNFPSIIKKFDAYPKTDEEFRIKTFSGAIVSIISGAIMLILFINEMVFYLTPEVKQELYVDLSKGGKMEINLNITFPEIPCDYLHVDVLDSSGERQLDVNQNLDFQPIQQTYYGYEKVEPEKDDRCLSCYGAKEGCCNTCDSVKAAYFQRGWLFDPKKISQCQKKNEIPANSPDVNYGCEISGKLIVNKVHGNFHVGLGKSFQSGNQHYHDFTFESLHRINLSHIVHTLSFGNPYPGIINPLDGTYSIQTFDGSMMFQNFITVVPTIYQPTSGDRILTNQYSVYDYSREIYKDSNNGLPGVFFFFDFSPIVVHLQEQNKSFFHFLTQLCAIIGGVFTVSSLIDSAIYRWSLFKKKRSTNSDLPIKNK
ncbi:endoplasmic reticulum-golgi intermediate compartment protein [Anaeramoeba ignava]|uniref:Endoplasmic reticulum-golgi intermediate compartment protein n=1 Tax=Anaeramoeba ignava TaxID=1746090 RepID=A0A9Q0R7X9_ANAIG|nr:endoplasmic reticulum-golgi intermediate compartment protein [Anaeramoeba ignava]